MSAHKGPVLSERKRVEGFTLVELLVVISIIAILSVIGITVFSGVQKNARDAKRRGDIDAIAKAMEVHYGETRVGWYAPLKDSYFASGKIPVDPKNAATSDCSSGFCYCDHSGGMAADYVTWIPGTPGRCATGDLEVHGDMQSWGFNFGYNTWQFFPGFIVCTNLESGSPDYYCKRSQQ